MILLQGVILFYSFVISGGGGLSGWQIVCGENKNIDWGGGILFRFEGEYEKWRENEKKWGGALGVCYRGV